MNTRKTIIVFGLLALSSLAWAIDFTGNAKNDFNPLNLNARQAASYKAFTRTDVVACSDWMAGSSKPSNPYYQYQPQYRRSGMDVDAIHMMYDDLNDRLYVGIECGGICGDTDGDGNPSGIDPAAYTHSVSGLGSDIANMCQSEAFSWMLWNQPPKAFNFSTTQLGDFRPNVIVGVKIGPTECLVKADGSNGLWNYAFDTANCNGAEALKSSLDPTISPSCDLASQYASQTNKGYGRRVSDPLGFNLPDLVIDHAKSHYLNSTYRHVEFYLPQWHSYPTRTLGENPGLPWLPAQETKPGYSHFKLGVQGLSSAADSCGEDSVLPEVWEIKWDCKNFPNGDAVYDICGDCGGDGTRCLDCFGVPNGTAKYDDCGVCDGGNLSCQDCFHVPYGPAKYDECGVCGGDNSTCWDCFYVPNGDAVYDACGVCGGDNSTCWDCAYVPNGESEYDACGVCAGDNSTCWDCAYVPNGKSVYDECGVCGGDNSTCWDCFYVPNGPAVYDECGVCDGDNTTCDDCFGVPHGPAVYDECGVCDGDSKSCADCAGTPNGHLVYDACHVCGGNNSTCEDCDGVPFGDAVYDRCGVCNGDNSTCTCYKYLGWEAPELCHSLLRWSIAASRVKLTDTLDVLYAIKNELPYFNWKSETGALLPNYLDTVHMFCEECLDNFDYAQAWFADRLAGNCIGANCEDLAVDQMSWQL